MSNTSQMKNMKERRNFVLWFKDCARGFRRGPSLRHSHTDEIVQLKKVGWPGRDSFLSNFL